MYGQELAQLSIFKDLSPKQLNVIQSFVEICEFPKDTCIFEQGELANYLYIIIGGEVVVRYKPYDGPDITVTHINAGGIFGWSAALGRTVYTSAAISTTACEVFRFRAKDLHRLIERDPDTGAIILDRLAAVIAERIVSTHNQVLTILTQAVESGNN